MITTPALQKILLRIVSFNNNSACSSYLFSERHRLGNTFFSAAHGTFSEIHHILGHKSSLSQYMKIHIISYILLDPYINDEQTEKEIRKIIPFTKGSKNNI
jgi:hypothetical protein